MGLLYRGLKLRIDGISGVSGEVCLKSAEKCNFLLYFNLLQLFRNGFVILASPNYFLISATVRPYFESLIIFHTFPAKKEVHILDFSIDSEYYFASAKINSWNVNILYAYKK